VGKVVDFFEACNLLFFARTKKHLRTNVRYAQSVLDSIKTRLNKELLKYKRQSNFCFLTLQFKMDRDGQDPLLRLQRDLA
jgi:hypothetical protein